MTTPLQAARDHLNNRASVADDAGDWAERMLLSNLYDVADYMCRIGDHVGRHYHADKSGPLVHAAMRVRKVALERYGGMFDRDVDRSLSRSPHTQDRVARSAICSAGPPRWPPAPYRIRSTSEREDAPGLSGRGHSRGGGSTLS